MTSPAWENLDVFFNVDDFATRATFSRAGVVLRSVDGIFDEPVLDAQIGEYVSGRGEPRLTCKSVDVLSIKKHDTATIAAVPGATFEVVSDPNHDGAGTAVVSFVRRYAGDDADFN